MAKIRLTESQLQDMIIESVKDSLDEGFFDNLKTGAKTFFKKSGGLQDKFSASKKNFALQKDMDALKELTSKLKEFVDKGQIDPNKTVAQLIGGAINNNRFGSMDSRTANMQGQINRNMR